MLRTLSTLANREIQEDVMRCALRVYVCIRKRNYVFIKMGINRKNARTRSVTVAKRPSISLCERRVQANVLDTTTTSRGIITLL